MVKIHIPLGKYLKEKRIAANLTQAELGRILDYTPQFITNWERGACSPPAHTLRKLVRILKIPEKELLQVLCAVSESYWREVILSSKKSAPRKKSV